MSTLERADVLKVGRWYRLRFPGLAARVLAYEPQTSPTYPYLVQGLLGSRWWCDGRGEPNNHMTARLRP